MTKSEVVRIGTLIAVVLAIFLFFGFLKFGSGFGDPKVSYYVSPDGNDNQNGTSRETALKTIQKGLELAHPSDTIHLDGGVYYENIKTVREGGQDSPIKIIGSNKTVLKSPKSGARILEINHSFITIEGFTIDGEIDSRKTASEDNYADKLIYVTGTEAGKITEEVRINNMSLKNAGGECMRLRYLIENSEISNNAINRCGIYDFQLERGGKNGEGIYLGTAPEQLADGKNPDDRVDESNNNHIYGNKIDTRGNECIDIKESSHQNTVEGNICTGQTDSEAGGISIRGNDNSIIGNEVYDIVGAGIRLGGDSEEDGINNEVTRNLIRGRYNAAFKIVRLPQAEICGNKAEGSAMIIRGEEDEIKEIDPTRSCE